MSEKGIKMENAFNQTDTLPKIFLQQVRKYGSKKVAMRKKDYGVWNEYTWDQVHDHVRKMALGLKSLGLERGDKVSILGDNDPEWFWAQLAGQSMGGVTTGIFIDCNPSEVKYYIEHSDSKFIFARDQEQVDKVLKIQDELPALIKIIYWDPRGLWFYDEPKLMNIQDLEDLGEKYHKNHPGSFEKNISEGKASDIAIICYTSGTTGLPKGAMISHRNFNALYEQVFQIDRFYEHDEYLSYISPAWVAEQMFGICFGMRTPFLINFPEKPETIQEDLRNVGPRIVFYGARLWESLAASIRVKILDTTPVKRFFFNQALRISYQKVNALQKREPLGLVKKLLIFAADFFVLRPLRDRVGLLRARSCYTAGAYLGAESMRLFQALGVNLKNMYGGTETGIATCHRAGDTRAETVGPALPGVDIRISDKGEIQIRSGAVFEGYYKNPEASAERFKDGFYSQGDAGYIDESGHLIYYDRLEDMVDLPDGTKFSPQYVESRLRFSVYIQDAVAIGGEGRPFVIVLISMDYDNVAKWAEKTQLVFTTFADLSQKQQVRNLMREEIIKVNQVVPPAARINRFVVLPKELDPDEAEMTRTRKVKRRSIEDRYFSLLKCMYSEESELELESEVKYQDGRIGRTKTVYKISQV